MAEKTIKVTISAAVKGLREIRQVAEALQKLQDQGDRPSVIGKAFSPRTAEDTKRIAAEIRALAAEIRNVEPTKLQKTAQTIQIIVGALSALQIAKNLGVTLRGVTDGLRQIGTSIGQTFKQGMNTAGQAISNVTNQLPSLAGGAGGAATAIGAVGAAGAVAATGIGLVVVAVGALVLALVAAIVAIPAVIGGFSSLFKKGIEYQANLEQTRLGIASIITSLGDLESASGRKLTGADALAASFELADEQLEKLKIDAINTIATFEQIAPAFQSAIGPGLSAGLTLDQIREVTVKIAQAAGAVGIPFTQLNQEVRAILDGTINEDARLAKILGISNELVKTWKAQGTLAAELEKRLAGFSVAGIEAAKTWDGLTSNLQEALNVFAGKATTKAFDALKAQALKVLPQLFDFKSAGLNKSIQALADLFDSVFVRVIHFAGDALQIILQRLKAVSGFVGRNRAVIDQILDSLGQIVRAGFDAVVAIQNAFGATISWRGVLLAIAAIARVLAFTLSGVAGVVQFIGVGFANAASAITNRLIPAIGLLLATVPGLSAVGTALAVIGAGKSEGVDAGAVAQARTAAGGGAIFGTKLTPRPKTPGATKGGGGGKQSSPEETASSTLALETAEIESQFGLFRDLLERQKKALEQSLDDRLISIRQFYAEQSSIEQTSNLAELARLDELKRLEREKFETAKAAIDADKSLDAKERAAKLQNEENRFAEANLKLQQEIEVLKRSQAEITERAARGEKLATEELQKQAAEIRARVLDEQGRTSEAATVRIRESFRELLGEFKTNFGEQSQEVRDLIGLIDLLIARARTAENLTRFDATRDALQNAIALIQSKPATNVVAEFLQRRAINEELQKYIGLLEDSLVAEETRAATNRNLTQEELNGLRARRAALEQLKNSQRDFSAELKDAVIDSVVNRLTTFAQSIGDVITGTKSLSEAFREMAAGILQDIANMIIKMLILKAIMAVLKAFAGGGGDEEASSFNPLGNFASGGPIPAAPGGVPILAGEGGYDEMVVSTDPRYRNRTAQLLGAFVRRTGILPDLSSFTPPSAGSILSSLGIPKFAAGDFVSAAPALGGSSVVNQTFTTVIQTPDVASFRRAQASIERDLARAAQRGVLRYRKE